MLARKLKQVVDKADPQNLTKELLRKSSNNPDSRDDQLKELTARTLIPVAIETDQNPEFAPDQIHLDVGPQKTELEIKQENSDRTHKWSTREIFRLGDNIADKHRPADPDSAPDTEQGKTSCEGTPNEKVESDKPDSSNKPLHNRDDLAEHL